MAGRGEYTHNREPNAGASTLPWRRRQRLAGAIVCGRMQVPETMQRGSRPILTAVVVTTLLFAAPATPAAHEIPSDVTVQAFVKPDGHTLRLLARVPLRALRDMDFPLRGPGYLDLAAADAQLRTAAELWIGNVVALYEDGGRLGEPALVATRVSIPSDRSFVSYETALANVISDRLPDETELYWEQGMLDALFEYTIESDRASFAIHPGLERLGIRVRTVLRFLPPTGAVRAFEYHGDVGLVRLDPSWRQAALRFVRSGVWHILNGIDHLLFLLCLVIPFRRWRTLVPIVTAFTAAHSVTLIAAAYGIAPGGLWFPPLVETLIAASIVYMALENILGANQRRRWVVTFAFGLVHGFGFSFGLRESLQFAGSHLLTSLLAFNVGVELGQLAALVILVPGLNLLFRWAPSERVVSIVLSALVAHTAWHWMSERTGILVQYTAPWSGLSGEPLETGWIWLLLVLLLAASVRLVVSLRRP